MQVLTGVSHGKSRFGRLHLPLVLGIPTSGEQALARLVHQSHEDTDAQHREGVHEGKEPDLLQLLLPSE